MKFKVVLYYKRWKYIGYIGIRRRGLKRGDRK